MHGRYLITHTHTHKSKWLTNIPLLISVTKINITMEVGKEHRYFKNYWKMNFSEEGGCGTSMYSTPIIALVEFYHQREKRSSIDGKWLGWNTIPVNYFKLEWQVLGCYLKNKETDWIPKASR